MWAISYTACALIFSTATFQCELRSLPIEGRFPSKAACEQEIKYNPGYVAQDHKVWYLGAHCVMMSDA